MKILNKKIAQHKSSVAWLQRQAHDPYVARAQKEGYRARAAYKIIEMNEKYHFFKNGQVVETAVGALNKAKLQGIIDKVLA